uniref:Insertion element IS402-like domain-containing protein n=1 Tax=Magnetospirillum gryphiswaldense TaxID=55518 RepID=A4U203_9PROT|nr:hypothetical protein MGR_0850 [Magnetospirillum gryphiswaldense MSR-1]
MSLCPVGARVSAVRAVMRGRFSMQFCGWRDQGRVWRDLPEDRFGPYQTVKRRYYRWIEQGVVESDLPGVSNDPDME